MTCIVCAAWFPFSVHILNGITSINLIFIHCSVPTQCPILCTALSPTPCPHILSPHHTSAWWWLSRGLSPGAGVWAMGQSTLESSHWSQESLREFHCYTGHWPLTSPGQGHPGTPASGHRDTGLAWQVSPPLTVTDTLASAALHWLLDSRPREQITHTQERSSYLGIMK